MSNRTLRIIFILAVIVTALALITQYYYIKKAYTLAEHDFDNKAKYALRDVGENIMSSKYENYVPPTDMVQKFSDNYYVIKVGDKVSYVSLEKLLVRELTSIDLITDCEYTTYDCEKEKISTGGILNLDSFNNPKALKISELPKVNDINYYIGVYFPNRELFLKGQLANFKYSTAILLGLLGLLGYIVFIVFKQRRLQEIQKDFVNNMTHEFKTPLSSILITSEVLKNPNIVNNPQRLLNYATIINNETNHLIGQVERVLQMASTERGNVLLNKTEFVINDMAEEIVSKYRPLIKSKEGDIQLTTNSESISINADRLHIRNVMSNLIDNALKYTKVPPVIYMEVLEERKHIIIAVKDNGIGIAKEHQKHIFDKFYRVPTGDVHDVKGFGLGLSYVKLIVKKHGGEINCVSEFGKGTEFRIFIPKS